MGILEVLFLLFLTLKLIGVEPVADWSWWWVTAPLWPAAVVWALVVFGSIGAALTGVFRR